MKQSVNTSDPNLHIRDYLKTYTEIESPGFAVFLNGKWGSGKTYLIKNFIEESQGNKKKWLYVSLYGLSSTNQIGDLLFQELHPVLSSKPVKFVGTLFKGLTKAAIRVDLENLNDDLKGGNASAKLSDFELHSFIKNTENEKKDYILVFDDFERCSMPVSEVLGYINSFIEHHDKKVVVISNEEEVGLYFSSEEVKKHERDLFQRKKEKLEGRTFTVTPDSVLVYKEALSVLKTSGVQNVLSDYESDFLSVFEKSNTKNLRHLKMFFHECERLYDQIDSGYHKVSGLMRDLLLHLFVFFLEIRSSGIGVDGFFHPEQDEIRNNVNNLNKKYNFIEGQRYMLDISQWKSFFSTGLVSAESVKMTLEQTKYFWTDETPAWLKLWDITNVEDDEYEKLLAVVDRKWANLEYSHPGEILQVVGVYMLLSQHLLYDKTHDEIKDMAKEYIDKVSAESSCRDLWIHVLPEINHEYYYGYAGYGYLCKDDEKFICVRQYLIEKMNEMKYQNLESYCKEFLSRLRNDFDVGVEYFKKESHLLRMPIFKTCKPQEFINFYLSIKNSNKKRITSIFYERYGGSPSLVEEEREFMEDVLKIINCSIEKYRNTKHKKIFAPLHLSHLKETFIEYLKRIKPDIF